MDSKFIICVVLANLAQSLFAVAQTTNVGNTGIPPGPQADCTSVRVRLTDYGLSPRQAAAFQQIIDKQDAALTAAFDSFNPVFNFFKKSLDTKVYNRSAAYHIADETYRRIKSAVDNIVRAISLSGGKTCHIPGKARAATYEALENIWISYKRALEIVGTKPHSANRAEIEALAAAARGLINKLTSAISDAIRSCVDTTNTHTLAVIEATMNDSIENLLSTNEAFYNMVAGMGTTVTHSTFEHYKTRGLNGKRNFIVSIFALLRAIFLSNHLNLGDIVSTLYTNQYLEILLIYGHRAATAVTFATFVDYLQRIYLGRPDAHDINSPALDASQRLLAARYQIATIAFTDSVLNIVSTAVSAPLATPQFVGNYSDSEAADYYDSIKFALNQGLTYSGARIRISGRKAILYAGYTGIIQDLFDTVRGNQSPERNIASGITTLQRTVTILALCYIDQVFAATNILAGAARGIRVLSDNDFVTVENLRRQADFLIIQLARAISVGQVRVIRVQRAD